MKKTVREDESDTDTDYVKMKKTVREDESDTDTDDVKINKAVREGGSDTDSDTDGVQAPIWEPLKFLFSKREEDRWALLPLRLGWYIGCPIYVSYVVE